MSTLWAPLPRIILLSSWERPDASFAGGSNDWASAADVSALESRDKCSTLSFDAQRSPPQSITARLSGGSPRDADPAQAVTQAGLRSVDRPKKSQGDLAAARYADVKLNHVSGALNRNDVAEAVDAFTLGLLNFDDPALDEPLKVAAGRRGRTSESCGKRRGIHRLSREANHHVAAQIARQQTEDQTDRLCIRYRRPPFLASLCDRDHSFSGQPPPSRPFPQRRIVMRASRLAGARTPLMLCRPVNRVASNQPYRCHARPLPQTHPFEISWPRFRRRAARTTSVNGGSAKFDSPPPLHGCSPLGVTSWLSLRRWAIGSCTTIH